MKASIITIGDELLIGQTVDTNSAWMGAELTAIGFDVYRMTSVHDRKPDILEALSDAEGKSNVVLVTGGLGPTSDDITKHTLCEYFNTTLVLDATVLGMITDMLSRRQIPLNDNNRKQAEVPADCRVLTNAAGTAPGMWFEKGGTTFISMPGVPSEMKYIMNTHVLPELKKKFISQKIVHRNIMTYGTYEARLAELLTGFEASLPASVRLAYLPSMGVIKLRLTGTGGDSEEVRKQVDEQAEKLYSIIPQYIYGENEEALESVTGRLLKARGLTLSTAESCTGGNIAHLITTVPGSSAYFMGSIIAYDNSVKKGLLYVDPAVIDEFGAVSKNNAEQMARGVRRTLSTDFSLAVTGIAGPDGGTEEKPVGTVWIAVDSAQGTVSERKVYGNDRNTNISRFSLAALNLLRMQILSHSKGS